MCEKKEKIKNIYKNINKKKFSEMEDWEKFIHNEKRTTRRRVKKQSKNEILFDNFKMDSF